MASVVKGMDKAMSNMNLEQVYKELPKINRKKILLILLNES
jgi:hypothetical protein